jgi:hypothetical protein
MKKEESEDLVTGMFLYFIPVIGLYLIWRHRKRLKPMDMWPGIVFGIISLMIMVVEIVKYV